jgi:hypothetical protein
MAMTKTAEIYPTKSPHLLQSKARSTTRFSDDDIYDAHATTRDKQKKTLGQQQSTSEWSARRRSLRGCYVANGTLKRRRQESIISNMNSTTKSKPKGQELDPIWQDLDWYDIDAFYLVL